MVFLDKAKKFLGFEDELLADSPLARQLQPEKPRAIRTERPERRENKLISFPGQKAGPMLGQSDVVIISPKSFEDPLTVASYIKRGNPVVVNIKNLDNATGKRFVDILCGTAYAFDGMMYRLGGTIFLFTPAHMGITPIEEELPELPNPELDPNHEEPFQKERNATAAHMEELESEDYEFVDPMAELEEAPAQAPQRYAMAR